MNWPLLKAVREQGYTQRYFSKVIGDDESRVSRIINGVWNPDPARPVRYAKALKKKPEELLKN